MSGRLRCWPGALAYIVKSKANNAGILVEVLRPAKLREAGRFAHFGEGHHWLVRSLGRPIVSTDGVARQETALPDARLRPITPPPGTESTTTDAAQPVEAA